MWILNNGKYGFSDDEDEKLSDSIARDVDWKEL
jgi:hypothetical protein